MSQVATIALIFIFTSLVWQWISTKLVFFSKSNFKYFVIDFLANYIHYGKDIGVEESLKLDYPSDEILERRRKGQEYLASKLSGGEKENKRGFDLSAKLVDCRFALAKVLIPLMRELEFPAKRNFVSSVVHKEQEEANQSSAPTGMHQVVLPNDERLLYVGSDAVQTLGIDTFHAPIQKEINRRMLLPEANLRFTPTSLNPEIEKNASTILQLTNMDQVRYSLSGSEAVDAALKDIKSSCRGKDFIVRFTSAYHGHVSGVDYLNCKNHIFLKECDPASIEFIEKYHYRICAVIVNPMQHFTGINKPSPPGEKLTMGGRNRKEIDRDTYAEWLHGLQSKCKYCTKYLSKVAFVLDDIYFSFRTPELFSFRYFKHPETGKNLDPDVLILGKGIAAGYPLSMVLGKKGFLNTYDKKYLLQVNKTVGTLAAWYGGVVASNVYLEEIKKTSTLLQLEAMVTKFNDFTSKLNKRFESEKLPVRIRNFSNTFSINYLEGSFYNCRYPQYLMAEGIFLGNYSTGKFNLNDDVTEADLIVLADKFVAAAQKMSDHGYFESSSSGGRRRMMVGFMYRFLSSSLRIYYDQIMEDKHIDIEVSHNHPVNKFGHFWSSVGMILLAYPYCFYFGEPLKGCLWFFLTHFVRQSGHFFYEHQDRDIEKLKFGHKDGSKKAAVAFLIIAALTFYYRTPIWDFANTYIDLQFIAFDRTDQYVSLVAMLTILPHFVEIIHEWGWMRGISWFLKILTDPFTDLLDFYEYVIIHPKWFLDFKDHSATYKLDLKTKKVTKVGEKMD